MTCEGRRSSRRRGRSLAIAALCAATGAVAASVAVAAAPKPVVLSDAADDVSGALDLTRVALRRADDGRVRVALSFADRLTPRSLLAGSGPPGSACLRIWTSPDADPATTRPDRLVCVTARSQDELRGGVYDANGPGMPRRLADASATLAASGRSIVMRFTQSSIGRPASIRFVVESTRPGCVRVSCIDTVPDGGAARRFRLR